MITLRKILIVIFILVSCLHQWARAQKLTFDGGLIAGVYGIDMTGDKEEFWDYNYEKSGIPGFSAGAFARTNFSPDVYGVLELRYAQKGTTYGYINQFFTQSFETIRFDYIEIPVLFGTNSVYHSKSKSFNFSIETGFAFSKLFSSRIKYAEIAGRLNQASLYGFKDYDISWVGQVKFPYFFSNNNKLVFGIRMERSLVSIHRDYKLYNFTYGFEVNYVLKNL